MLLKFRQRSTVWLPVGATLFLKNKMGDTGDESLNIIQREIKESYKRLEERMDEKYSLTMKAIKELKALISSQRLEGGYVKAFEPAISRELAVGIGRLTEYEGADLKPGDADDPTSRALD